ncbi:transposase [Streptomyces sp. NPDC047453]|uniref:transposase n=1 Tax=Streptomyces sp. NPDC047453 TaxID=3154812 RepID=UPI00340E64B6
MNGMVSQLRMESTFIFNPNSSRDGRVVVGGAEEDLVGQVLHQCRQCGEMMGRGDQVGQGGRAHIQLGGPIVLVWDNLNTHLAVGMKKYVADHDWLTIFQLPSYAPDLNPVEGIWSLLRRGPMANTAFTDPDHLIRILRRGLTHIQHRPRLIDGCLTETGLAITTPTPTRKPQ